MKRLQASLLSLVLVFASIGCGGWYSTNIARTDGTRIESIPRCVRDGALIVDSMDEGIPTSDIERLRSHAGIEPMIAGGLVMAAGAALLLWWATDVEQGANDARLPIGAVTSSLGLIKFGVGLAFTIISTGSLNRTCSPRFRPGAGPRPPT